MTTKVFLMLNDFIESNLVLDEKSNFDIELINVLLRHFILPNMLYNCLSQSFEFNFFVKIEITVIEEVHKILDGPHRRVLSIRQTLVRFSLLSSSNETLELNHFFHVLIEISLLFGKFCTNEHALRSGLE